MCFSFALVMVLCIWPRDAMPKVALFSLCNSFALRLHRHINIVRECEKRCLREECAMVAKCKIKLKLEKNRECFGFCEFARIVRVEMAVRACMCILDLENVRCEGVY